ncbi:hypothetical protein T07_13219 [Trichinella nelsoni]|uniref:Uncharacterized protein n=1 Tax=Trichinella nelsoni TaxID=6336 RepID=A0A0V0RC95_9BILA|nr:hypothetical protein T07_13219 [Trichinella nelsoni]
MEINFKCLMPKLMKGATPNKLIKGVTANLMSIIGQVSEPALAPKQSLGTTSIANLHNCL